MFDHEADVKAALSAVNNVHFTAVMTSQTEASGTAFGRRVEMDWVSGRGAGDAQIGLAWVYADTFFQDNGFHIGPGGIDGGCHGRDAPPQNDDIVFILHFILHGKLFECQATIVASCR